MIPRELLKKIRQIEIRTNRLVSESVSGAYHSVFKGQGMNFDEVREYQPGDDVRAIDWNVTARMSHPFIKKFVEERELAAEIASVLAFSAIRNNDKVGLVLFSDEVEKFIPPRKGRRHVLRVIREILFFEPKRHGTDLPGALHFVSRMLPHKSVVVVLSDFLEARTPVRFGSRSGSIAPLPVAEPLAPATQIALRQAHRRHDLVAVQITDRFELELPALGRLVLKDAETGEVVEVQTGNAHQRATFAEQQMLFQGALRKAFRTMGIDSIQLRTDQPYSAALGKFFDAREKRRRRG